MEITSDRVTEICVQAAAALAQADLQAARELPEPFVSDRFRKKMKKLLPHVKNGKYHSLTATAKVILVAALIALLLLLSVSAKTYIEKYLLIDHGNYSDYIIGKHNEKLQDGLQYGYIPERFALSEEKATDTSVTLLFSAPNGDSLIIKKSARYDVVFFDTESRPVKEFHDNGIDYLIYGTDNFPGIIWKNNDILYYVTGALTDDELIKIALEVY